MAGALVRVLFRQVSIERLQEELKTPSEALNELLHRLMMALLVRRVRMDQENDRTHVLEKTLGCRLDEALQLVQEINTMRLSRASLGCSTCLMPAKAIGPSGTPLPTEIPTPVKKLFFHNELCNAVERAPLKSLNTLNWNELIERAKLDLKEYREWCLTSPRIDAKEDEQPVAKRARQA